MRTLLTLTRLVSLVSVFLLSGTAANAATLYGKVEQVDEGDVITVNNLNRPIKIRLLGIDAPEKDQPYAEAARQHLSDLVLNKFVVVHYSGLGHNSYILGRVVLGEMDVCAQMLRDGVAWFDSNGASRLSQVERETYALTEQTARTEHRGIWQDVAPVPPWDFKREVAERRSHVANSALKQARTTPSLATDDLLGAVAGGAGRNSLRTPEKYSNWKTLSPSDFKFSVLVPANAFEQGALIPTATGRADVNIAEGSHANSAYMVIWAKGPNGGESDIAVIEATADDIGRLLNLRLKRQGSDEIFKVRYQRSVKTGSLNGRQYELSIPGLTGLVRVFASHTKNERQVYVLCVMNGDESDQPVREFLDSLKMGK